MCSSRAGVRDQVGKYVSRFTISDFAVEKRLGGRLLESRVLMLVREACFQMSPHATS